MEVFLSFPDWSSQAIVKKKNIYKPADKLLLERVPGEATWLDAKLFFQPKRDHKTI